MLVNEITGAYGVNITKLKRVLVGKQSIKTISGMVKDIVSDSLGDDIEVSVETSLNVDSGEMSINAYYDPDADQDDDVAIEIVLIFNPGDRAINWDKQGVDNFVNELSDALKHELLHANQYRNRDFVDGRGGYDRRGGGRYPDDRRGGSRFQGRGGGWGDRRDRSRSRSPPHGWRGDRRGNRSPVEYGDRERGSRSRSSARWQDA